MTAALYARRKSWPLESVTVRLRHNRIHAEDCANCETRVGLLDRIDIAIEFTGPLTDEQRTRLYEITERCPVRRTLESEIVIQSRIAPSAG